MYSRRCSRRRSHKTNQPEQLVPGPKEEERKTTNITLVSYWVEVVKITHTPRRLRWPQKPGTLKVTNHGRSELKCLGLRRNVLCTSAGPSSIQKFTLNLSRTPPGKPVQHIPRSTCIAFHIIHRSITKTFSIAGSPPCIFRNNAYGGQEISTENS
jgi:hypothetical protein